MWNLIHKTLLFLGHYKMYQPSAQHMHVGK